MNPQMKRMLEARQRAASQAAQTIQQKQDRKLNNMETLLHAVIGKSNG